MRILINEKKDLQSMATLIDGYSDICDGLTVMEEEHTGKFGKSLFPVVITLLKKTKQGFVESDDETFDKWTLGSGPDYDWEANDLYGHLFNGLFNDYV